MVEKAFCKYGTKLRRNHKFILSGSYLSYTYGETIFVFV